MPDYIPRGEANRILWMANLAAWLNAHGAAHGFTPAEISAFSTAAATAKTALSDNVALQAAARAGTVAKKAAIATALEMARDNVRRIQSAPNTTDEDRGAAGITIPDTNPTPAPADEIMMIEPPLLLLDFSIRRQVGVHWGPNPGNEQQNGRPAGTRGCQIQAARGGIPTDEATWTDLGQITRSPHIHAVHETTPTTYAYRARYVGNNLKYGPYSAPATCTVSV